MLETPPQPTTIPKNKVLVNLLSLPIINSDSTIEEISRLALYTNCNNPIGDYEKINFDDMENKKSFTVSPDEEIA